MNRATSKQLDQRMHVSTTVTAHITAEPEAVFDLANSAEDAPRVFTGWGPLPGTSRTEVLGDRPLDVGVTRRVFFVDGNQIEETILEYIPGSAWSYTLSGIGRPFSLLVREGKVRWTLKPEGHGVRVTWTCAFDLRSPLAWPIASVLMFFFTRMMRRVLTTIARTCEQPQDSTAKV